MRAGKLTADRSVRAAAGVYLVMTLSLASNTEAGFDELVETHRADLHAHCYRMLGSLHDADDALQDTLLRAWRALPRFRGESSTGPGSTA